MLIELQNQLNTLATKQYTPRMEKLQQIETILAEKMEEFCLTEERIENDLLCPRDLVLVKKPITLIPCGVKNSPPLLIFFVAFVL